MIEQLRDYFDEMVVYKDLKKSNFFSILSLPSFMRDWLLKKFEDDNGEFDTTELLQFVRKYLPRQDDWTAIKNRVIIEGERVKFLAKIVVDIDIKTREVSFAMPDFGLPFKDTIIEERVWDNCKADLLCGGETWGMVELAYRNPEGYDIGFTEKTAKGAKKGKIKLVSFKAFCPYTIDLEYYKDAMGKFRVSERIDILLGAVDYNANGYHGDEEKKLTMLTRLLPFVEKRLNLIELAPKGTGKSYLFGQVSRYTWLVTGGNISRAKMFYDLNKSTAGLVAGNDFITFDEVQKMSFGDKTESEALGGMLQTYLENGSFRVGTYESTAYAGLVLCGNIPKEVMDADGYSNMFEGLPAIFKSSALIDRFHGFIKGWKIPRMNDDLKVSGWALNSEYFCSIMHELREDMSYRAIVDELIEVPDAADTRDTEAVKRITTAYLKLLFPNVRKANDISANEFNRYCLRPARLMRDTIKTQLGILDPEYKGKDMPVFNIKEV
ncbi:BREX system Lon protease-like protein BrxL [Sporomusa paucivorans]|uniref:BREX system Lon protease-like protein BrxL n=1 Tax=Sporomusa paucivorans TaxID=2376 RepID=UPI00357125BC